VETSSKSSAKGLFCSLHIRPITNYTGLHATAVDRIAAVRYGYIWTRHEARR